MILFYAPRDPYGFFSNFARYQVRIYDKTWRTSEHAFQAMKYWPHRPDLVDLVWAAESPAKAAELGRDRSKPIRTDWDQYPDRKPLQGIQGPWDYQPDDGISRSGVVAEPLFQRTKDVFMYEIVYAKFSQIPDLRKALIDTGSHALIENAVHDPYWGWGASHVGENKLGRILMAVRHAFNTSTGKPLILA